MKRFATLIATIVLFSIAAFAQTDTYSNYHGTETLENWGTGKAETYSLAMFVDDANLTGRKLKSVRIPVNTAATNATGYSLFLAKELNSRNGEAIADIMQLEFEPEGEWADVALPQEWSIEEGGFYVGYSFKVTKIGSDDDGKPVVLMNGGSDNGLWVISRLTYRKWTSLAGELGMNVPLQLQLEATAAKKNAVAVVSVADVKVKTGNQITTTARIANHGTNAVSGIDYVFDVSGAQSEGHITFDVPMSSDVYGTEQEITVNIPAVNQSGTYSGTLGIVKVNGETNEDNASKGSSNVRVLDVVPVKRPLLEEFTGTWCGNCPRGYIGMLEMTKRHPDDFIGIAYHNHDAMQITEDYPVNVEGFPVANIDRCHELDPYFGDGYHDMDIEKTWLEYAQKDTPLNIEVEASISKDGTNILVTSTCEYAAEVANSNYGLAYVVTADGLKGNTRFWRQENYYSGATGYGDEMNMFINGEREMLVPYDDVAIAQSGGNGETISGVLPANARIKDKVTHEYSFELASMVGIYGQKEYLVQDTGKLNVVAIAYDNTKGCVLNAAKCHVDDTASGITAIASENVTAQKCYSLDGKGKEALSRGINILRLSNGNVVKVIR